MLAKDRRSTSCSSVFAVMAVFLSGSPAVSSDIWDDFIITQSEPSYVECRNQIEKSSAFLSGFKSTAPPGEPRYYEDYRQFLLNSPERLKTVTALDLLSDEARFEKFLGVVGKGDRLAIELAFLLYPLTDGSGTEDLNSVLGMTIRKYPAAFMESFREHSGLVIDPRALAIGMDYELIDDLRGQLSEIDARLKALEDSGKRDLGGPEEFLLGVLRARRDTLDLILRTRPD